MKSIYAFAALLMSAVACSCSDDKEDDEFRYQSASPNTTSYEVRFTVDGEDVNDAFMNGTHGYCTERGRDFEISKSSDNSFTVKFPSPNAYNDFTTERTDNSTIYKRSYSSDITIANKTYNITAYFENEALDENKELYMDEDYSLKSIKMGDKEVTTTIAENTTYYSVQLIKSDDGTLVLKE